MYRIVFTPRSWETGRYIKAEPEFNGYIRPDWKEIYINLHGNKDPLLTLIHELIHASIFARGEYLPENHNEDTIDAEAEIIYKEILVSLYYQI